MKGRVLRKDFLEEGEKCVICNKTLKSGKGYYVQIERKDFVLLGFAGKECAKKIEKDLTKLPDLTHSLKTKRNVNQQKTEEEKQSQKAIEYLLLRQDKLKNYRFENGKRSVFRKDLENYKKAYDESGILEEDEIEHLLNIEKKVPPIIGYENLSICYAYEYKIRLALKHIKPEKQAYLKSKLAFLKNNCFLKKEDLVGIERWFENIEDEELRSCKIGDFITA